MIGPSLYPIPDQSRQILIHWAYASALGIDGAAKVIKVSPRALKHVIKYRAGVRKETFTRLMRFVKRLERREV